MGDSGTPVLQLEAVRRRNILRLSLAAWAAVLPCSAGARPGRGFGLVVPVVAGRGGFAWLRADPWSVLWQRPGAVAGYEALGVVPDAQDARRQPPDWLADLSEDAEAFELGAESLQRRYGAAWLLLVAAHTRVSGGVRIADGMPEPGARLPAFRVVLAVGSRLIAAEEVGSVPGPLWLELRSVVFAWVADQLAALPPSAAVVAPEDENGAAPPLLP